MTYAVEEYAEINRNRKQGLKDDGFRDDDWRTAAASDLDCCAEHYGLDRTTYESDDNLRSRIEREIDKRKLRV